MVKVNFRNDYSNICHKDILKALQDNINNIYTGYGLDIESKQASDLIKHELNNKNVDIHFLPGGTITNKVFISHVLKPYEAVIAATTGHINVHETGTIEQSGHKVLTIPSNNGKINPSDITKICDCHTDEHMVKPKMVYISNPTELGSVYTYEELKQIRLECDKNNLYFYIDGARLASALTSLVCNYTMADLANLSDAFYIGGTKNGLLLGEALVIVNEDLKEEVRYSIKHFGGMYAKGFVCGIEFKALFTNNLFYEIGKYQNELANKLYNGLKDLGIKFLNPQESNQIFPIFNKDLLKKLENKILFEVWEDNLESTTVRFVVNYLNTLDDILNTIKIVKEEMGDAK